MTRSIPPLGSGDPQRIGKYQLLGVLGQGGQGTVFLGAAPGGERVAVKVVSGLLDVTAARAVAPFCTARILDEGTYRGRSYVVSEYVPGPSLEQALADEGPRPEALSRLAVATLNALGAIHAAGVAHGDFKPGNVIMSPEGPVVIDFGTGPAGTPAFMAPELFAGGPATAASDVFAWAVTMAWAATGRSPFPGGSLPAVMNAIVNGEPELGGVPDGFRSMLAACLAKESAARPGVEGLLNALTGKPLPSAEVTLPVAEMTVPVAEVTVPARRGRARRTWWIAGSAALAVAVAAGVLVVTTSKPRVRQAAASPSPVRWAPTAPALSRIAIRTLPVIKTPELVTGTTLTELDGRAVAVIGVLFHGVMVFDLVSGKQVGRTFGKAGWHIGTALTTTTLNGRPVGLASDAKGRVWVFDLRTGKQVGEPILGSKSAIDTIAVVTLNGIPTAVYAQSGLVLANLNTRVGQVVAADARAADVGRLNGRPVAFYVGDRDQVKLMDLTTAREIGPPRDTGQKYPGVVRVGGPEGRLVGYSGEYLGSNGRVWDLTAGTREGTPVKDQDEYPQPPVIGMFRGRLVLLATDQDKLTAWDLDTGDKIPVSRRVTARSDLSWAEVGGKHYVVADGVDHLAIWTMS